MKFDIRAAVHAEAEQKADFYRQGWKKQSDIYQEKGFYDDIERLLSIKGDELYVDIGSGAAQLPILLRTHHEKLRAVCMERSAPLIRTAKMNAYTAKLPVRTIQGETLSFEGDRPENLIIRREYRLNPQKERPDIFSADAPIVFIQDDVREAKVIRECLGEHKIDVCTHTFPGSGGEDILLFNQPLQRTMRESPDKRNDRILEYTIEMRKAAARFATRHVKSGGTFTRVERMVHYEMDDEEFSEDVRKQYDLHCERASQIDNPIHSFERYWEKPVVTTLRRVVVEPETPFAEIVHGVSSKMGTGVDFFKHEKAVFHIIASQAVRNDEPFIEKRDAPRGRSRKRRKR